MPDAGETAQQWIATMRAQGHSEAALRKGLEETGWSPEDIGQLLGPPSAPPPSFGTPPPPTYMATAAPPTRKSKSGLGVGLLIGCGCLLLAVPILAAILFPVVFARARDKGMQTSCLANIKQLMGAEAMYAQDNNETLPPAGDWPQKLAPYDKNDNILLCPADQRPEKQKSADKPTSYTMSDALGGLGMETLRDPANLGVLFDGTQLYGLTAAAECRHNDGLNVGYVDGHCKWLTQESFATVPLQPTPESSTPSP